MAKFQGRFVSESDDGTMVANVDGQSYKFSRYGQEKCSDLFLDLIGVLGEPVLTALAGNTAKSLDDDQRELIAIVTGQLCSNLSGKKATTINLIKAITTDRVLCENNPINFDIHFRGRMVHMIKVFVAGMEAQFGDFFTGLRALFNSVQASDSGTSQGKTSDSDNGSSSMRASAA